MDKKIIPKTTLGRLPRYLQYLKTVSASGCKTISATSIASNLFLGEVQVRKDLALVSGAGKPKTGYDVDRLTQDVERHLGQHEMASAILVGAGKLGKALLDYYGFREFGVDIVAAFDCNEKVLNSSPMSKPIMSLTEMKDFCKKNNVRIGIITVGQGSAQSVCDLLLDCGIIAIWNFAPCNLNVPNGVVLKQENLALSLAHLKNQIS